MRRLHETDLGKGSSDTRWARCGATGESQSPSDRINSMLNDSFMKAFLLFAGPKSHARARESASSLPPKR